MLVDIYDRLVLSVLSLVPFRIASHPASRQSCKSNALRQVQKQERSGCAGGFSLLALCCCACAVTCLSCPLSLGQVCGVCVCVCV